MKSVAAFLGLILGFVIAAIPAAPDARAASPSRPHENPPKLGVFEAWTYFYHPTGSGSNESHEMIVDAAGNIYVIGGSEVDGWDMDFLLLKVKPDGQEDWVKIIAGPAENLDFGSALALAPDGNIIAAGHLCTDAGRDLNDFMALVAKYDPAGAVLWSATYDNPDRGYYIVYDAETDGDGNVYVAGYCYGLSGNPADNDGYVLKYDDDGVFQWDAFVTGDGEEMDAVMDLAVDSLGRVVVVGCVYRDEQAYNFLTRKYDADGGVVWTAEYDGPDHDWEYIPYSAIDAEDNVYLAGTSIGAAAGDDAVLLKYNAAGEQQWVIRQVGSSDGNDRSRAVAVDEDGYIYWAISLVNEQERTDAVLYRYTPDGHLDWSFTYRGSEEEYVYPVALSFDTDNHPDVAINIDSGDLSFVVLELDEDGRELWSSSSAGDYFNEYPVSDIAGEGEGNIYVSGYLSSSEIFLVSYICSGGCLINNQCFRAGDLDPNNICRHCDPTLSNIDWSDNDGANCDDGLFCTGIDSCLAGNCNTHAGTPCPDDALFCTGTEYCNEQDEACGQTGDPCVPPEVCSEVLDDCLLADDDDDDNDNDDNDDNDNNNDDDNDNDTTPDDDDATPADDDNDDSSPDDDDDVSPDDDTSADDDSPDDDTPDFDDDDESDDDLTADDDQQTSSDSEKGSCGCS